MNRDMALFLRRVILEHADRYVFSVDKTDVSRLRPRTVSLSGYNEESAFWANWRNDQLKAEQDIRS